MRDDTHGVMYGNLGLINVKQYTLMIGLVLVIALLAAPAAAFTMNRLDIAVAETGDADVTADYSLSWMEQIAVFMRIAQPAEQLQNGLEQFSGKEVAVTSVSPRETVLVIRDFAAVSKTANETTYTTPYLDFSGAEQAIRGTWFSRFVTIDASPGVSVVSFPDGYGETFYNSIVIPSITHGIPK
jgi:hypothetical protein